MSLAVNERWRSRWSRPSTYNLCPVFYSNGVMLSESNHILSGSDAHTEQAQTEQNLTATQLLSFHDKRVERGLR